MRSRYVTGLHGKAWRAWEILPRPHFSPPGGHPDHNPLPVSWERAI